MAQRGEGFKYDDAVASGQVSERKAARNGDGERRRSTSALLLQEPHSEWAATKHRGSSADSSELIEKVLLSKFFRAHSIDALLPAG
jgi:hypothetical protein